MSAATREAVEKVRAFVVAAYEMQGGRHFKLEAKGLATVNEHVKACLEHAIEHADFLLDAIDSADPPKVALVGGGR